MTLPPTFFPAWARLRVSGLLFWAGWATGAGVELCGLRNVRQTLHQSEGTSGGYVTVFVWMSWVAVLNPSANTWADMDDLIGAVFGKASSAFKKKTA